MCLVYQTRFGNIRDWIKINFKCSRLPLNAIYIISNVDKNDVIKIVQLDQYTYQIIVTTGFSKLIIPAPAYFRPDFIQIKRTNKTDTCIFKRFIFLSYFMSTY